MKWSNEQTEQLKELCMNGVSNKEIAKTMGIDVKDVYAKRSQLGITIDKCKQAQATEVELVEEFPEWTDESVPAKNDKDTKKKISSTVSKAFDDLSVMLLIEAIKNNTTLGNTAVYMTYSMLICDLKKSLENALQAM